MNSYFTSPFVFSIPVRFLGRSNFLLLLFCIYSLALGFHSFFPHFGTWLLDFPPYFCPLPSLSPYYLLRPHPSAPIPYWPTHSPFPSVSSFYLFSLPNCPLTRNPSRYLTFFYDLIFSSTFDFRLTNVHHRLFSSVFVCVFEVNINDRNLLNLLSFSSKIIGHPYNMLLHYRFGWLLRLNPWRQEDLKMVWNGLGRFYGI